MFIFPSEHDIDGNFPKTVVIEFEPVDSEQLRRLLTDVLPDVLRRFAEKNAGYRAHAKKFDLGPKAEYVEIHRKVGKLYSGIWEGDEEVFKTESADEVIDDLIGHLLLLKDKRSS